MTTHGRASTDEAARIGELIGIDWTLARFDVEEIRAGMEVELEHAARDPATGVTGDDPIVTGKIALAHLNEFPAASAPRVIGGSTLSEPGATRGDQPTVIATPDNSERAPRGVT